MSTFRSAASASPADWAQLTFGSTTLGDPRRTARLVQLATAMAARPGASLPHQLGTWPALKGGYRLLDNAAIDFAAIIGPHCAQTRQASQRQPVVLLVQDTTTLDFSRHRRTEGLGPIGDGRGLGFHLQTVLAVDPATALPLGVLAAEPWTRHPKPGGETRTQRLQRTRESERWGRLARMVGPSPVPGNWVHVADREADCFDFLAAVVDTGAEVLVRIAQNRRVVTADADLTRLFTVLQATPAADQRRILVPHRSRPTPATLAICWQRVQVLPPVQAPAALAGHAPIAGWAIRVWEPDPPAGVDAIAWQLLTTRPVTDAETAWERVQWYTRRWVIEEFHQCLKTGCAIEASQIRQAARIERQLAILVPLAVRLLQLRSLARIDPDAPVDQVAPALLVTLVATHLREASAATVGPFLHQIARLGGWLGRKNDGPPGWRILWRGWLRALSWLEGAELARTVETW